MSTTFNEYQAAAKTTATYPDSANGVYPVLGLVGEAGETAEKIRNALWKDNKPKHPVELRVHDVLSLAAATGKICERLKKEIRDKGLLETDPAGKEAIQKAYEEILKDKAFVEEVTKEIGDVSWYQADLATNFGVSLGEVADKNIAKLKSRKERGVLQGSGDNR